MLSVWTVFMFAVVLATAASAGNRVALVIGNSQYERLRHLDSPSPVDDATDIADALSSIGFNVIRGKNLSYAEMLQKIDDFVSTIELGDTALFYFSGHGADLDGNYYLPIDVPDPGKSSKAVTAKQAISEAEVISDLKKSALDERAVEEDRRGTIILIIDACRNVPAFGKAGGLQAGFKRPAITSGIIALYAAGIGQIAFDKFREEDTNRNSVFTRELLPLLKEKGLRVTEVGTKVSERVSTLARKAGRIQSPAMYVEGGTDVYLAGPPVVPTPPLPREFVEFELEHWHSVKDSNDIAMLQEYLNQYPNGKFVGLAKLKIASLTEERIWAEAEKSKSVPSISDYLVKYPNGRYAELAKSQIGQLQDAERQSGQTPELREQRANPQVENADPQTAQARDLQQQPVQGQANVPEDEHAANECRTTELSSLSTEQQAVKLVEFYYGDLDRQDVKCAIARWASMTAVRERLIASIGAAHVYSINLSSMPQAEATAYVGAFVSVRSKFGNWEDYHVTVALVRSGGRWKISRIRDNTSLQVRQSEHLVDECRMAELNSLSMEQQAVKLVEFYYGDLARQDVKCAVARWASMTAARQRLIVNIGAARVYSMNLSRASPSAGTASVNAFVSVRSKSGNWEDYDVTVGLVWSDGMWKISGLRSSDKPVYASPAASVVDECRTAELSSYSLGQQTVKLVEFYYRDLDRHAVKCAMGRWSSGTARRKLIASKIIENIDGARVYSTNLSRVSLSEGTAHVNAFVSVQGKSGNWQDYHVTVGLVRSGGMWKISAIRNAE